MTPTVIPCRSRKHTASPADAYDWRKRSPTHDGPGGIEKLHGVSAVTREAPADQRCRSLDYLVPRERDGCQVQAGRDGRIVEPDKNRRTRARAETLLLHRLREAVVAAEYRIRLRAKQ